MDLPTARSAFAEEGLLESFEIVDDEFTTDFVAVFVATVSGVVPIFDQLLNDLLMMVEFVEESEAENFDGALEAVGVAPVPSMTLTKTSPSVSWANT